MTRAGTPWGRRILLPPLAGAVSLLALAFGGGSWIVIGGILGLTALFPFALYAPALMLVLGVVTGPATGSWLSVNAIGPLPAITVDRVLLMVVTSFVAIRWLRRPASISPINRTEILMAVFLVIAALSAITRGGSDTHGTVEGGLRIDFVFLLQSYAVPFVLYFLGRNLIRSENHMRWLLGAFIVTGVFIATVAILQLYAGLTFFNPTRYAVTHYGRAVGTLSSAPHFGIVMVVFLLTGIIVAIRSRGTLARIALLPGVGLMLASLYLCKTRANYLGLILALGIIALMEPRLRRGLIVAGIVCLAALVLLWPIVSETTMVKERIFEMEPIYNRLSLYGISANMIVHEPILGYGFGRRTFLEERAPYMVTIASVPPVYAQALSVPHNEYLHILILLGLVGFVPYLLVLLTCWRDAYRTCRMQNRGRPWEHEIGLIALGVLSMYLFSGLLSDLMPSWYGSSLVFFLVGVAVGIRVRNAAGPAQSGPHTTSIAR